MQPNVTKRSALETVVVSHAAHFVLVYHNYRRNVNAIVSGSIISFLGISPPEIAWSNRAVFAWDWLTLPWLEISSLRITIVSVITRTDLYVGWPWRLSSATSTARQPMWYDLNLCWQVSRALPSCYFWRNNREYTLMNSHARVICSKCYRGESQIRCVCENTFVTDVVIEKNNQIRI